MSSKHRSKWRWGAVLGGIALFAMLILLLKHQSKSQIPSLKHQSISQIPSLKHQSISQMIVGRWEGRGPKTLESVGEWVMVFDRDGTFREYYGPNSNIAADGTYSLEDKGTFYLKTHVTGYWDFTSSISFRRDTGPGYDGDTSDIDSTLKVWINGRGDEMTLQPHDPPAFRRNPAYIPRPAVRYRRLRDDEKVDAK